ncbi:MAG: leucine-rich repeat domain-containing protein [Bacteroidales bacterium]|nr:leucine-rich repeat domain-containing protein [Bacteroidales bacterium]
MSKIAVFEYGKISLAEWINNNSDCEKMILVGKVFCDLEDKHCSDLLIDFNDIAKDLKAVEFDITDLHLLDYKGNIDDDDFPSDCKEKKSSMIFKMLVNRKHGTKFIYNNGILTTPDGKVLIYLPESKHVIVPEGIEIIGNWAFALFDKMNKIDLPNSLKEIGDYSFGYVENLKELIMPDSIEKLGEGSFGYSEIDVIKVSDKIETFPAYCFRYCRIDKLPSSLKTINDDNCFEFLNENEVIEFPNGFEHLGRYSIGYIFEEARFPATTKYIAENFWYDYLVGPDETDKPTIIIDSDNPYFSVDENNNLVYKCVADIETTRDFSRRSIGFVESETERNYLLERDILLSPKDIINLVEMSPEYPENLRTWFYWDLAQTTILTEQERLMLSYVRKKTRKTWKQLHSFLEDRILVAFGISYEEHKEVMLGKYKHSLECTQSIQEQQLIDKYDIIIARQYKTSDKKLENELGRFEIVGDYDTINNVSFENYPIPQNIENLIDAYINLPHPFEAGDIVKVKNRKEQFVVAETIKPTKEQIESKYVDSSDMAVTVLPIEYSERVRECLRNGDKIPEELFNEHQHLCFLSLEMVEKFCS